MVTSAAACMRAISAGDLIMRQALTMSSPETILRLKPETLLDVVDDEVAGRMLDGERPVGGGRRRPWR